MSLLGGLIFEGMEGTLKSFQQLSRDAQIDTVNKTAEDMRNKLTQIQTTTEQIRSAHIRENLSLIVNDLMNELGNIVKQAPKDPLGSFVHLLFLPMSLIFRGTELIWGSLYGWLLNMFYPTGPVSYEEARMNAIEFFTLTGDFNAIATIFDILGDIQVLGTKLPGRAIGNFIRNISWTFGLGWMTWVVMSPVLRVSIAEPMEAEMRRITRPKGWTETDVRELYEFGIDKLEDHVKHLAEQGYSDDKIEKLLEITRKRVLREEARRFVTDMAAAYVKGYITDDELMKAIELAYWTEDERNFRYWEERTRRESKIIDLRIDEIERAFKTAEIDENEARARLSEFIVEPRMVEAYIALWKQYRKPEELIDPLEEAQYRLQRLKIRIAGLEKQIMHLEIIEKQQLDVYDAQIEELRTRLEARIAAAREEFAAYAAKTTSEIEARILYYEALIPAATGLTKTRYEAAKELLEAIAEARIGERERRLNALIEKWTKETEAEIEELKARLEARIEAAKAEFEAYATKTISEIEARIRYYESLIPAATGLTQLRYMASVEMLQAIAVARIEERERVLNALIEKWTRETEAKIEELRTKLEAKIAAAKEEFAAYSAKTTSEIEARIEYYEKLMPEATGLTKTRYEAAIEMLEAIKEARIEERERRLNALIEKWTKETEAKIKVIEERKEKYEAEMNERLDRLRTKLEEYELEKTATERVIERLMARV